MWTGNSKKLMLPGLVVVLFFFSLFIFSCANPEEEKKEEAERLEAARIAATRQSIDDLDRLRQILDQILDVDSIDAIDLDRLFMPVGLHLGGNAPAAVALSIAAEMQAVRHGIAGHVHMRDRRPRTPEEEAS